MTQKEKAEQFFQLHHDEKMLVLPNIWDPLGALMLQDLGYKAIATASAAIAYSNGYNDGEHIPFDHVIDLLTRIANAVDVPVTADIESGYATDEQELSENIKRLIATGIAGINIEDYCKQTSTFYSVATQCLRIKAIRKAAAEMGTPLFINARTDVLLQGDKFPTAESKLAEIIARGEAYKDAGADCFFPIVMKNQSEIKVVVAKLKMPVNILAIPGIPALKTLHEIGVARVSLGPSFLKTALQAMKQLAIQLKELNGLDSITQNEISSDYLKELVNKSNSIKKE